MNREHIFPQILLRSWPFPRGAGRLIDKLFRNVAFSEEIATVRTTDGFYLDVMPNELIGRHIYLTGEFDRSTVEVLCQFAKSGDTLLDIGANIGYVSACFLQGVEGSKVIAVEPQPGVVDLLKGNLKQFGSRATVYPFAISNHDGAAFLEINSHNRGASRIGDSGAPIQSRTPASLFRDTRITSVDIVKIDVEGFEEEVIASCLEAFGRLKPRAIMFEEHGAKAHEPIGGMLRSIGYDIFGIVKHLTRLEYKPVVSADDCTCNDYVALAKDSALNPTIDRPKDYEADGIISAPR